MSPQEILDRLPDGVIVIDLGNVTFMNRAAERLAGRRAAESLGKPYGEVVPLEDAAGLFVHESCDPFGDLTGVATGFPERDYRLRRPDGVLKWVSVRAAYERGGNGRVERVVLAMRDAGRKQRLERAGYDLISMVAHELRSPLTSVKGFTSTLLHRWDRFADEQKQHMLRTINADADRVTRLLNDLLNVSRLESGRLELKRELVDVAALAAAVAVRLGVEATDYRVSVSFPERFPRVMADPGKIEQVITNLVENSLRHGDPGDVGVRGEIQPNAILVRVSDSGPGIAPEHLPHIFTKFYRRGAGERHAGSGLGLFICKGIVEAHGGEIEVEKSDPSGSTFAFTLPRPEGNE
jgi:PAS domain S-box-containing protein